MFISFEGPEGAGKSTQAGLLAVALEQAGWSPCRVREPGGTPIGDRLRPLLLTSGECPVDARAEALLYAAARAQLVADVVEPALREGRIVLSDRYADSTLAYQGYGRGIPLADLRAVLQFATGGRWPDLTILLDLPVELGLGRKRAQGDDGAEWTRFEAETLAFHERVREGYRALAAADPERWVVLDARRAPADLHQDIWQAVSARLAEPPDPRAPASRKPITGSP